ncbi:hypothetical protein [Nitrosophilus labii]|uniref:hypothetical protein n=1 Tax=Nitrosophilus labii TaxID=2706014 RepID=UPI0016569F8E|nr:hypothetical protein [Nitrosophilus labii]
MFKNKDYEIAYRHLEKSRKESEEATKNILHYINDSLEILNTIENTNANEALLKKLRKNLENSLISFQFQDIISQRLKKVEGFLLQADKTQGPVKAGKELEEFAWENEVEQEHIDDILKSHGL